VIRGRAPVLATKRILGWTDPTTYAGRRVAVCVGLSLALATALVVFGPTGGAAQQTIACGDSLPGSLSSVSDTDVYTMTAPSGAVVFLQGSVTSGDIDSLEIHVVGPGVDIITCRNAFEFASAGGSYRIEVSPCISGSGSYLISAHVVSDNDANCGLFLDCGATDDGVALTQLGEVDSFQFPGLAGERVEIRVNDIESRSDPYLIRVIDPSASLVEETCRGQISVATASGGTYTVLVSACGEVSVGNYRVERFDRRCPTGPTITSFAFLPQERVPTLPDGYDDEGRPIFESSGVGTLIVEGRAGASLRPVGDSAFSSGELPDFQSIASRPLGNGNPAVCDQRAMPPGGIAATVPFGFRDDAASINRINDLGCRINDGSGAMVGRRDPLNSCIDDSFAFEDPSTTIQFCGDIARSEEFPPGDTVLAARLRDLSGNLGAAREIVIRVPGTVGPTVTPTQTREPTPTPTARPTTPRATATPRPPGPCTSDCNDDRSVRIDELTRSVRIALGDSPLEICEKADRNMDGRVVIAELVDGVNNALLGCPPES